MIPPREMCLSMIGQCYLCPVTSRKGKLCKSDLITNEMAEEEFSGWQNVFIWKGCWCSEIKLGGIWGAFVVLYWEECGELWRILYKFIEGIEFWDEGIL